MTAHGDQTRKGGDVPYVSHLLGVASIVEACTDTDEHPKPPWRPRKERYLAHLRSPGTPPEVLTVSRADKLHNARSMLLDCRALGEGFWSRFNADVDEQLWYLSSLVDIF